MIPPSTLHPPPPSLGVPVPEECVLVVDGDRDRRVAQRLRPARRLARDLRDGDTASQVAVFQGLAVVSRLSDPMICVNNHALPSLPAAQGHKPRRSGPGRKHDPRGDGATAASDGDGTLLTDRRTERRRHPSDRRGRQPHTHNRHPPRAHECSSATLCNRAHFPAGPITRPATTARARFTLATTASLRQAGATVRPSLSLQRAKTALRLQRAPLREHYPSRKVSVSSSGSPCGPADGRKQPLAPPAGRDFRH